VASEPVEIVHIAAPAITFDNVKVQRCAWCGALIETRDFSNMAVAIDPSASQEVQQEEANSAGRASWKGFVSVLDGFPRILSAIDEPEDGKAPERSCMRLIPVDPDDQ
jgi:RNA polymerase subunit RPABC4/transcription elongation factor Spt4